MKHTVQDLINTVYEYFPRGIADRDPAYEQTPEWQRQKAARIPASARYETWRGMLRRLAARFPKEQFPEVEVDSECYFLQSPEVAVHLDRGYTDPPKADVQTAPLQTTVHSIAGAPPSRAPFRSRVT